MKSIIKQQVSNAKQPQGKEKVSCYIVVARCKNYDGSISLRSIVTARMYMGRSANASEVHCALWVHGSKAQTSGMGKAGGYGYHKESAALGSAINSAGIELYGEISTPAKWNYEESREYTPEEIKATAKKYAKIRAYIGGVGDSAMEAAMIAIARAAGAIGECLFVRD